MQIDDLIERVRGLTGPDRETDAEIWRFTDPDDALERVLPGMWRSIEWAGTNRPPSEWPVVEFGFGDFKGKVQAKTAPLAIVLALLQALKAKEARDGR